MTLIRTCLARTRLFSRSWYRSYANSATRTIDVHSIPHELNETKVERSFRTSINDPVGISSLNMVDNVSFSFYIQRKI